MYSYFVISLSIILNKQYFLQFVGRTESKDEVGPLCIDHIEHGSFIMVDGCGVGRTDELVSTFFIQRCKHYKNIYVKPCSVWEDHNFKVHDNLAENRYRDFRKAITMRNGLTHGEDCVKNYGSLRNYAMLTDWIETYTDASPRHCMYMWLQHCQKYFSVNEQL